jgi:WhiB family transcriptional regulator, redox-sensing transcriptional regulator
VSLLTRLKISWRELLTSRQFVKAFTSVPKTGLRPPPTVGVTADAHIRTTHIHCHGKRSVAAMDWRHRAACRDEDPELFFPIGTSGPALLQVEQAKAVCRRCPVTDECLRWALESGQDAGVWGGMSEEERRALKRRGGIRVGAHSF